MLAFKIWEKGQPNYLKQHEQLNNTPKCDEEMIAVPDVCTVDILFCCSNNSKLTTIKAVPII